MSNGMYGSRRAEVNAIRTEMTAMGASMRAIATAIRSRLRVNSRVAFRYAQGWTQQHVADLWNQRWPDGRMLTDKQLSYWETWPQNNGRRPQLDDLVKLAKIYECTVADLIDDVERAESDGLVGQGSQTISIPGVSTDIMDGRSWVPPGDVLGRVGAILASAGSAPAVGGIEYQQLVRLLTDWAQRMQRRDVLQWLSLAAAAAAAAPALAGIDEDDQERVEKALAVPSRVDDAVVTTVNAVLEQCRRQDDVLGAAAVLGTTLTQRDLVRHLLPHATGSLRDRLLSTYAQILRLAGWLSFDLKDFDAADSYYALARKAAHEAHDNDLTAYILCDISELEVWRGQPRYAIDYATAACAWAAQSEDLHLRAFAFDNAARAYAANRQQAETLQALETSGTLLAGAAGKSSGLVYFFHGGILTRTEGQCHLLLGRPDRAAAVLEKGLGSISSATPRERAWAYIRLGESQLRSERPDIPAAAHAYDQAVSLVAQNRSTRQTGSLRDAAQRLNTRWSDLPEVRDLTDRLTSYGITT